MLFFKSKLLEISVEVFDKHALDLSFRYHATLYPCPETQTERREMAIGVMTRIEDLNTVSESIVIKVIWNFFE